VHPLLGGRLAASSDHALRDFADAMLPVFLIRLVFGAVVTAMVFSFAWFIASVWLAMRSVA
jgi:hypothetical protein